MILCVIPARMSSKRFYGKPLVSIKNKSMLQRVYEKVSSVSFINKIVIATDSQEIIDHVHSFKGEAVLTSNQHLSGLDRVIEASSYYSKYKYILNVQGDEPLIHPNTIQKVLNLLIESKKFSITTAATPFKKKVDFNNINQVKVVIDMYQKALYFSRSMIPYVNNDKSVTLNIKNQNLYKHQGIYAYKKNILKKLKSLKPIYLESVESLEQLRFLYYNISVGVALTEHDSIGVDTPQDIKRVEKKINENK